MLWLQIRQSYSMLTCYQSVGGKKPPLGTIFQIVSMLLSRIKMLGVPTRRQFVGSSLPPQGTISPESFVFKLLPLPISDLFVTLLSATTKQKHSLPRCP